MRDTTFDIYFGIIIFSSGWIFSFLTLLGFRTDLTLKEIFLIILNISILGGIILTTIIGYFLSNFQIIRKEYDI